MCNRASVLIIKLYIISLVVMLKNVPKEVKNRADFTTMKYIDAIKISNFKIVKSSNGPN